MHSTVAYQANPSKARAQQLIVTCFMSNQEQPLKHILERSQYRLLFLTAVNQELHASQLISEHMHKYM